MKNKLVEILEKYSSDYKFKGQIVTSGVFEPIIEEYEVKELNQLSSYDIIMYFIGTIKKSKLNKKEKEIFQETWQYSPFKNYSNIISFLGLLSKSDINITHEQFSFFYKYNSLESENNWEHLKLYNYCKKKLPQINSSEVFKGLEELINAPEIKTNKMYSYQLRVNKLSKKFKNITLNTHALSNLFNHFSKKENYILNIEYEHLYIDYVFTANTIDEKRISSLLDFIERNHTQIETINDPEKSYVNFNLMIETSNEKISKPIKV